MTTTYRGSRKWLRRMFGVFLIMATTLGCIDDLTPQGGWSSPVVGDNKLLIGNVDGNLVRLDPVTGNVDSGWSYPREDGLGAIYADVLVADGAVYGSGYTCRGDDCEGEIFALDLTSGLSIWGQNGLPLKTKLIGRVSLRGKTLLIGTSALGDEDDGADGYLYALDATPSTSSIVKWRIPLDGNVWSGVAVEESMAYVATMAGTVYAINVSDGEPGGLFDQDPSSRIIWTFENGNAIAGPLHIADGNIYFGDLASKVYKLNLLARNDDAQSTNIHRDSAEIDIANGEWIFDAGAWVWAKPVTEDGILFVSALDGSIYALDDSTGEEIWSASIEGQIVSSPILFDRKRGQIRERALAVPSGDENVWVISVIDGRELGVFVTEEPVKSSPLVYDGNLYVHVLNGHLKWFSVDDTTERGCVELKGGGQCN